MIWADPIHRHDNGARFIDLSREHLYFILNELFHPKMICADTGGSCARIADITRFLACNLAREERLMELSGYPSAEAHKREHKRVLRRLDRLSRTLVCGRYDNTLIAEFLENWAGKHALAFDKPFGTYLRATSREDSSRR